MIKSPFAFASFRCLSGRLQLVPPDGNFISFSAFVITESRGFNLHGVTRSLNGTTSVSGLLRITAAATRAATSMHFAAVVEPAR